MAPMLSKLKGLILGRYLWITNTVTGGIFLATGDAIQQSIERRQGFRSQQQQLDSDRIGRMTLVGFTLGLPHHVWYSWLDRCLPGRSLLTVVRKICTDQLIASPCFTSIFFMGSGILEGHNIQQCCQELKSKFLMVYKTDCTVWPPVQMINFLFVPPAFRVIYINVITVAWNVFLSYAKYFDKITVTTESELLEVM